MVVLLLNWESEDKCNPLDSNKADPIRHRFDLIPVLTGRNGDFFLRTDPIRYHDSITIFAPLWTNSSAACRVLIEMIGRGDKENG